VMPVAIKLTEPNPIWRFLRESNPPDFLRDRQVTTT